jgi:hypothetical protein
MAIAPSKLGRLIASEWQSDEGIIRRLRENALVAVDVADSALLAAVTKARKEHIALDNPFNSPNERVRVFLNPYLTEKGQRWAVPLDSLNEPDDDASGAGDSQGLSPTRWLMRASIMLRFLLIALPGAALLLLAGPVLLTPPAFGPPILPRVAAIPLGIAALIIGAAMILYGTGRWGSWLYVLPFLALGPFIFIGMSMRTSRTMGLILLALPFVVAIAVRRHYRRQRMRG